MFEKLRPMFFSILYFQYNGGQGGFFSFFFSPSNQHPNVLLSVLWWVLSFSFHFFSLDQRPNRKANRRKKTPNQNSNRTSYHSLLSPQNCMFLCKTFFSFPSFSLRHQLPVAQAKRSKVCAHFYSSGDSGSQLHL